MYNNTSGKIRHQWKGIVLADQPKKGDQRSTASYVD